MKVERFGRNLQNRELVVPGDEHLGALCWVAPFANRVVFYFSADIRKVGGWNENKPVVRILSCADAFANCVSHNEYGHRVGHNLFQKNKVLNLNQRIKLVPACMGEHLSSTGQLTPQRSLAITSGILEGVSHFSIITIRRVLCESLLVFLKKVLLLHIQMTKVSLAISLGHEAVVLSAAGYWHHWYAGKSGIVID